MYPKGTDTRSASDRARETLDEYERSGDKALAPQLAASVARLLWVLGERSSPTVGGIVTTNDRED